MTLSDFRVQFPSFSGVPDALINAKLTAVLLEIDPNLFGLFTDQAQGFLCAHYLTQEPFGQNARMSTKPNGSSTYWAQFERIRSFVTVGFRVC